MSSKAKRPYRTKKITISLGAFGRLQFRLLQPKLTKKQLQQRKRITHVAALIIISLAGTIFFGAKAYGELSPKPAVTPIVASKPAPAAQPLSLPQSLPTNLSIESIGLNSPIASVALDTIGSITVPSEANTVGWYQQSVTPGEIGPAVIVGHLDSNGNPAVFWNLGKLQPGQTVAIQREDGNVARFAITEIGQYNATNYPVDKIYGSTSKSELRLITCGGNLNVFTGRYESNTVVFAELIK